MRSLAQPIRERPVTAYELAPVARPIALVAPHVGESDARAESRIRRIAREDCACRASVSVSINASEAALDGPSAHSTKAVTLR